MDDPFERLARYIEEAYDQGRGDRLEDIAKRAHLPSYQRVQNILKGHKTPDFIPVCVALGLDPMEVWYGGGGEPFDSATRKILTIIRDWEPERRAALAGTLEGLGPSGIVPAPGKRPRKKALA